jgi:threonine synthase
LFAGAIAGIVGAVISIVRTVLDPGAIRDAALKANPAVNPSALTDQVIIATGIVSAIIGLLFILGVGAGAGALGGLLGRQKYQPASYQESMYQGLPPQPPVG